MIVFLVLGAVLVLCLGMLLGSSWTLQGARRRLRLNAAERRDLNAKIRTLREARQCWQCGHRLAYATCCCHDTLSEADWVGSGF